MDAAVHVYCIVSGDRNPLKPTDLATWKEKCIIRELGLQLSPSSSTLTRTELMNTSNRLCMLILAAVDSCLLQIMIINHGTLPTHPTIFIMQHANSSMLLNILITMDTSPHLIPEIPVCMIIGITVPWVTQE